MPSLQSILLYFLPIRKSVPGTFSLHCFCCDCLHLCEHWLSSWVQLRPAGFIGNPPLNANNDFYSMDFYRTLSLENLFGALSQCLILVSFLCEFMSGFPIFHNMLCEGMDFDFSIMLCIKLTGVNMNLSKFISLSHQFPLLQYFFN